LDACVLYPAPLRDLLIEFAAMGLFLSKVGHSYAKEKDKSTRYVPSRCTHTTKGDFYTQPEITAYRWAADGVALSVIRFRK
jgi:hypothetical protein